MLWGRAPPRAATGGGGSGVLARAAPVRPTAPGSHGVSIRAPRLGVLEQRPAGCRARWRPCCRAAAAGGAPGGGAQQQQEQQQQAAADEAEGGDESEGEDEGAGFPEELSQARHVIIEPEFTEAAAQLRAVFDERFEDPRRTMRERFLWDWWHVENQYTLVRTQAAAYFPKALYRRLEADLLAYGERVLGCRSISPVWMSYYVDSCVQELHCDSFHGPFAFVLSLTNWDERKFTGGETMILKPATLDFWGGFVPGKGLELTDLVTLVPPRFNQLTLFDPRLPHGVRPVHGTKDPRQARLVLHGWFTEPSPFIDGALEPEAAVEALNEALDPVFEDLELLPAVLGTLTARIHISGADGSVAAVELLADTLVVRPGQAITNDEGDPLPPSAARAAVQHAIRDGLAAAQFPPCEGGDTFITYPFVFE